MASEATDTTGAPAVSAAASTSPPFAWVLIRARSIDAPLACSDIY